MKVGSQGSEERLEIGKSHPFEGLKFMEVNDVANVCKGLQVLARCFFFRSNGNDGELLEVTQCSGVDNLATPKFVSLVKAYKAIIQKYVATTPSTFLLG